MTIGQAQYRLLEQTRCALQAIDRKTEASEFPVAVEVADSIVHVRNAIKALAQLRDGQHVNPALRAVADDALRVLGIQPEADSQAP